MELAYRRLDGRFVCLEPFVPALKDEVRSAIDCDPETWAIMPHTGMGDGFESYWSHVCTMNDYMPYAIRRRSDGRVVGMSGFLTAQMSDGGVQIGGTFLHPDVRAGVVNPESKLLMLGHAFASGAVRVQFMVDTRNHRSQAAIAKLGAVREGVLRRDRRTWTGYIRDSVVFSILDNEWPAMKAGLERRLEELEANNAGAINNAASPPIVPGALRHGQLLQHELPLLRGE
jgi:RimJ/RimL family protein N-acetyltransferase